MSRDLQFPQHLFSIDKSAGFYILLRGGQCSVKGGSVHRVEPVTGIERQEVHFSSLRKLRRLIYHEPGLMNAGLESHAESILRIPYGATARLSLPPINPIHHLAHLDTPLDLRVEPLRLREAPRSIEDCPLQEDSRPCWAQRWTMDRRR